jgi:hypothetical protein
LSFFVLFILYPGISSLVFKALQCDTFDGVGEDGHSFLRADFSIDCVRWPAVKRHYGGTQFLLRVANHTPQQGSPLYTGFMLPYALVMVAVYPVGVPLYFALILLRNKESLNALQRVELSITTEKKRAHLGTFLKGRARREYQPEIDEAEERMAYLQAEYDTKRNGMPTVLRKLTSGYEMKTYWFGVLPYRPNHRALRLLQL